MSKVISDREIENSIPPMRDYTPEEVVSDGLCRWVRVMDNEQIQAIAKAQRDSSDREWMLELAGYPWHENKDDTTSIKIPRKRLMELSKQALKGEQ